MDKRIVIEYDDSEFIIKLNNKKFKTDSMELMIDLANQYMVDLLWGGDYTVLDELKDDGGNYVTDISSDNAKGIIEFLEDKGVLKC